MVGKTKESISYAARLLNTSNRRFGKYFYTFLFSVGTYSVLQVVIALQRHTGYFLIQIYLPCTLLVVLSWVGFWLNREATSDRVGLGKHNPWGKIFSEALFLIIFLCTYIFTSYSKNFWIYVFILNLYFSTLSDIQVLIKQVD